MIERERASSFGAVADAYDRARPSYPAALVDWLADGLGQAVDVGCGTGKLGRLLAGRGVHVVGVEHDERMAAVARGYGLDVEVAAFESWDPGRRRFDLVASAQAWHWVDQALGARKAAEVLRPGGRLAVVWNLYQHAPDVRAALEDAYRRTAPQLLGGVVLGMDVVDAPLAGVDDTDAFGPQSFRHDVWQQRCTTDEWLDQLPTHSDHATLSPETLRALLDAVAEAVPDGLTVTYTTLCIWAERR